MSACSGDARRETTDENTRIISIIRDRYLPSANNSNATVSKLHKLQKFFPSQATEGKWKLMSHSSGCRLAVGTAHSAHNPAQSTLLRLLSSLSFLARLSPHPRLLASTCFPQQKIPPPPCLRRHHRHSPLMFMTTMTTTTTSSCSVSSTVASGRSTILARERSGVSTRRSTLERSGL